MQTHEILGNILLTLLVVVIFAVGLFALSKAIDRHALATCVQWNDCEEVAKTIK